MFRFTIRDVLWLTVVVALGVMLWLNYRRDIFPSAPYPIAQHEPPVAGHYSNQLIAPYFVEVTDEAISSAPRWDRRNPDPPLPANEVIVRADLARKRLIKENKVREDPRDPYWVVSTVELTPYDLDRGLWYWVVEFETNVEQSGPPSDLRLVVLMNGTVVEPTKEKTATAPAHFP